MTMKGGKPNEEIINLFTNIIPADLNVERRKMFGYPCCFYNGNMFMGVHGKKIVIRLSENDREEFRETQKATIFEPIPGSATKEYYVIPEEVLNNNDLTKEWVKKSLNYAKSLPEKKKKLR